LLAQGEGGELRAGGRVAAQIGRWRMEPTTAAGHVVLAAIEPVDVFWFSQPALDLYLAMGPVFWYWQGVQIEGNQIQIQGLPEVK
jgi:hypothetical protein